MGSCHGEREGIILGCTEIPLLVGENTMWTCPCSTRRPIHAEAALKYALAGGV